MQMINIYVYVLGARRELKASISCFYFIKTFVKMAVYCSSVCSCGVLCSHTTVCLCDQQALNILGWWRRGRWRWWWRGWLDWGNR